MSRKVDFSAPFKTEAVSMVIIHGYSKAQVAERLGVPLSELLAWIEQLGEAILQRNSQADKNMYREFELIVANIQSIEDEIGKLKATVYDFARNYLKEDK